MKCQYCGGDTPFYKRFFFNVDNDIWLPCTGCGRELLTQDRFFNHLIITGIIFLASLFFDIHQSWFIDISIKCIVVLSYFYGRMPLKKKGGG